MNAAGLPLSPPQRGMLFASLASRRAELYLEQFTIALRGSVDPVVLHAAWRALMQEHPILRTAFDWTDGADPRQIVFDDPPLHIASIDFRALASADRAEALEQYLAGDRTRAVSLSEAPLFRVALVRCETDLTFLVWTHHHILLDGWCVPMLVRDLVAAYDAILRGNEPAFGSPRPYSDYIGWLAEQDDAKAAAFWKRELDGIGAPTALGESAGPAIAGQGFDERKIFLSRELTERLRLAARKHRVPFSAVFEGLWALLLSRYSGEARVVFGTTVSGRPAALDGSNRMIGLFINTIPAVIGIGNDQPFWTWVRALHRAAAERKPFEHCGAGEIHEQSSVPRALPLFESVLVFENYPFDTDFAASTFTIDVGLSRSTGGTTRYPLTLMIVPRGSELVLHAVFDTARLDAPAAGIVLQDFLFCIETVVAASDLETGTIVEAMARKPLPRIRDRAADSERVPPRNETEETIFAIWSSILGIDTFGIDDNFFALGGHSLLAARVLSRLRETLLVDLTLDTLLAHPTIASLSVALDLARPLRAERIPRLAAGGEVRATLAQQRLFFLDRLEGTTAYNALAALRLKGPLDAEALHDALDRLAQRHEVLRTSFRETDGEVFAVVHPEASIPFEIVDRADPAAELLLRFDLGQAPLLRVLLVREAGDEHVLLLTIHHIITDGWSNSVFFRELAALYAGEELPELPLQFGDYAEWQRRRLEGPLLEELSAYWNAQLEDAPRSLALPYDFRAPAVRERRAEARERLLSGESIRALEDFSRAEGVTLFTTLLAGLNALLHRWSGEDDLVIGTPVANRNHAGTENLIGFFVNTLVLRTSIAGRPSFRELVRRGGETVRGALAHQEMPFERLIDFQILFNMLNVPPARASLRGLDIEPIPLPDPGARFDLTLYAAVEGERLRFEALYDRQLFRGATIERFLGQLEELLAQCVRDPDRAIDEYPLAPASQAIELLESDHGTIHEGFLAQAARTPERIAIVDAERAWTYAEVAAASVPDAMTPGAVLPVHASPSADFVIELLTVLRAGGAFLILDGALPAGRRRRMLHVGGTIEPEPGLAYVTFTSGSTGMPKAIRGTHNPVTHFLDWHVSTFGLHADDRFALLAGFGHDPLLRDVFTPLRIGASLHIPPARDESLASWMREQRITVAHLTPAVASLIVSEVPLRLTCFGGDRLTMRDVRRLRVHAPSCTFVNFYGATETPQAMAFHVVDAEDEGDDVPIGRGIDGVELVLLNTAGHRAAAGELGEICIRTPYLARGYAGGPDFGEAYRTGDLGRLSEDGTVVCAGRRDRQVKVRGHRVDLREIEATLEEQPSVRKAVAMAIDSETLVAFVVGEYDRSFLAERLPPALVPSRIVSVGDIPLTRNGKVDERALATLLDTRPEFEPPRGEIECTLAGIWQEVLGLEEVGAGDHFFERGGHSLKAMRVASRIERAFSVRLPLREILGRPILRDLAGAIAAAGRTAVAEIVALPPAESYAVSHAQRRLWTLAQLGEGSAYSMPRAYTLDGPLDVARFETALHALAARHESLRTTFELRGQELRQLIHDVPDIEFTRADVTFEEAIRLAGEDAARPFDLDRGPLVRFSLLRIGGDDTRHVLLFNIHHIVADAWSLDVLVRDLAALYAGEPLPPLRIQHRDYPAWQNGRVTDDGYWRNKLAAPLPVLDLPADRPRPAVKGNAGDRVLFSLGTLAEDLQALCRERDASLFTGLAAAVTILLHRYTGQRDVIVGTPVAGRTHPDLEPQIGCYVNMLALRSEIDPETTAADFLDALRGTVTEALEHQDAAFDQLVAELGVARDASRSPLFDVVVVLQNGSGAEPRIDGVDLAPLARPQHTSKFDLNFTFDERGEALLEYDTALFDRDRAERIVAHFLELLRSIVRDPQTRIGALNLLPEEERRLVVDEWNATAAVYPHEATIASLFDARAASQPDAMAMPGLTYGELRARVHGMARALPPQERIAVVLDRSERIVIALLAVLQAGSAYVPIDPSYPVERIRFILEDCGARTVLSEAPHLDLLAGGAYTLLDAAQLDRPGEPFPSIARPADAAYVIYTSGSTGKPKGCVVTHRNVVRLLVSDAMPFDFGPDDVWICAHSFAFDFSVWETYGALLYGGRLVIASRDEARNPAALRALVRRHGVTVLNQTPAAFYGFMEVDRGEPDDLSLRYVIFGGDRLEASRLRDWAARHPRVRLVNMYGITETTVHVTFGPLSGAESGSPIGVPLPETRVYVCDARMNPQPAGVPGELYVGGSGVCDGYLNRPELTAQRFLDSPFVPGERLYRTGDVGRWRADGTLEYLGRNDDQVQIRGHRIELGEVQRALSAHPAVAEAYVGTRGDDVDRQLVAWIVGSVDAGALRAHARLLLPEAMVPAHVVPVERIPLTANGKVDRRALPDPQASAPRATIVGELETRVATIWCEVLGRESVGLDENFFDAGGHSLGLVQVHRRLRDELALEVRLTDLFQFPTIRSLLDTRGAVEAVRTAVQTAENNDVAIIGMACRFPGAADTGEFWRNLRGGVEAAVTLTDDELRRAGVGENLFTDARYVRTKPVLDGIEDFDADFFGISPRDAEITDPQHRLFLECAWTALENAGYDPKGITVPAGVFAGASFNSYLFHNLASHRELLETIGVYPLLIGNDRDFVSSRVSYKLNLRGPSLNVSTACSTSLVAVHLACRSLISGECDLALAGGASVKVPQHEGYLHDEGGILSPDGRCRAFDARANGTVGGSGAGIVVLKRLAHAVRDGDAIRAIIRGTAIGNDGADKVGYTAPGVTGQASVIAAAHAAARVDPRTISYVEAHGTGTSLGDPVEIAALTRAFATADRQFCAIGSVKTNIGHLDAAAGVAGLIKTVLALEHAELPPSLNYDTPNPNIDFADTPFAVNARLTPWRSDGPRRAGVSSFGLGGTNAHAVLEEAPRAEPAKAARPLQLVVLSARTPRSLDATTARLAEHFAQHPNLDLADAAFTLAQGRPPFVNRRFAVCGSAADAALLLGAADPRFLFAGRAEADRGVAFLFSGGGAQYAGMGRELYEHEPVYTEAIDRCAALLPFDVRDVMYGNGIGSAEVLRTPSIGLPALFATEYALARLWMSWGVVPSAMIGHSAGEITAACIAGVFSLEDALRLVATRGLLFERIERGEMVSVPLGEERVAAFLGTSLSIAAINHPDSCVVSGPVAAVDALTSVLAADEVETHRLHIAVAAHSPLVEPILSEFRDCVASLDRRPPRIPFLSNLSGTWITDEQACDPAYWESQLRRTVRFADGIAELLRRPEWILLETGPGNTLASLAQRHPERGPSHTIVHSLRHPNQAVDTDYPALLHAAGRLWCEGVRLDWQAFHGEGRRRVPLPGSPFERKRFWIEPKKTADERRASVGEWFYTPMWRRTPAPGVEPDGQPLLVITDDDALAASFPGAWRVRGGEAWAMATAGVLPRRIVFDGDTESLLQLAAAWPGGEVEILVVATGTCDVLGDERLDIRRAAILGPVKVISQERPHIRCRAVDPSSPDDVRAELQATDGELVTAYRHGRRWVLRYDAIALEPAQLRQNGVYLITGGTGAVGTLLAEILSRRCDARLALVGRHATAHPERENVLLLDADVADESQLRAAVEATIDRFGALHGVIHAAGVTSGSSIFTSFDELSADDLSAQLRPKAEGVLTLDRVLGDLPLDFVLLLSSNASVLGGLGLAAYAAANQVLDAFASERTRRGHVPWISASWDAWPTVRREAGHVRSGLDRFAMSRAEAEEALLRVLSWRGGHVVISAVDLRERLARWIRPVIEEPAPVAEADVIVGNDAEAPPRDEVERSVATLWREMLGVSRVGIYDNFFDLRGDSLLGSRLITRINALFRVRLPLRALFEDPTVAGLATRIHSAVAPVEHGQNTEEAVI